MKRLLLFCIGCWSAVLSQGQTVEETYPKTLWCPNDTFALRYKGDSQLDYFTASRKDHISPGTDAAPGEYVTLYFGSDSLQLRYHNKLPYAHIIYLTFASPKGTTKFRFHFNDLTSYFPAAYIQQNNGNVQFDIPEVYELANIIWALSPSGKRATDLNTNTDYYRRVLAHFGPFQQHPLFRALDLPDSAVADKYYDFRENSFAFNLANTAKPADALRLDFSGPYYYVYGNELADSSLFGKLKPLVEDFATRSHFRQFYRANASYYAQEVKRQRELLPVRAMWNWLETQFPGTRYQSYRVVFSPLIGGSHSTQNYATFSNGAWFKESVFFICGPDRYDTAGNLTEHQKEALLSGVLFTEIDHNYVNPVTNKYGKRVDSLFAARSVWTKTGTSSDFYGSPRNVFNEYMTWAVFCLYVQDKYDAPTARLVIDERTTRMVNKRSFTRFKEFNEALAALHQAHPELKVVELYPFILDWCAQKH